MAEKQKNIILTGDRPTGKLHIGHYVGSLKRRVALQESGAAKGFVNASPIVDTVRACKSPDEAQKMRESSKINDAVMDRLVAYIKEGMTELELADIIKNIFVECGADKAGFAIVAFGANAADPHHRNDNTRLKSGDCVLIDMGCVKTATIRT